MRSDIVVAGGGLVGLSCAAALAARGATVAVVSSRRPGEASPAAAGMLAPSVEAVPGLAHEFALAARDRYPSWVATITEATGMGFSLDRSGILQLALDDDEASRLRVSLSAPSRWVNEAEVRKMEPGVGENSGAVFHPDDGWVDNTALLRALRAMLAKQSLVSIFENEEVTAIRAAGTHVSVSTTSGAIAEAGQLVIAAGAWSAGIRGQSTTLPLKPVRGQMLSVNLRLISHVIFGPSGYVVPRSALTFAGSTMEDVGFHSSATPEGRSSIIVSATRLCPAFSHHAIASHWAGLRPMTPDGLPILCRDDVQDRVIYACGHSRNGILLAPVTADCVAAMANGEDPPYDLSPFSNKRFSNL
ncbi:MAG: glycine oxidase ThiO [Gemmatimonadaceae bacterium]